jgi:hypothetical protein
MAGSGAVIPSTGTSRARQASARPFLHSLNSLVKYVRLYGFNHQRTQAQLVVAWSDLQQAVPKRKGSLTMGTADGRMLIDGESVDGGQTERGFAQLLTDSGVASIQFCSGVTLEEFENLVRALSLGTSRAQGLAAEIKRLFPDEKSNIRVTEVRVKEVQVNEVQVNEAHVNEAKADGAEPVAETLAVPEQLAAQTLAPEFKEWLGEPTKLAQLIAAESTDSAKTADSPEAASTSALGSSASTDVTFPLNRAETSDALRLITRIGELGAAPSPKPEMIGLELHRSQEIVRKTVLSTLDELSTARHSDSKKSPLMRAAEQMAVRYALEQFQSGALKVNGVRAMLDGMAQQLGGLRKMFPLREDKLSKPVTAVESHSDLLDGIFWTEVPEHDKKKALLSPDAACVPAQSLRQYVELLLERGDRENAAAVLENYAGQVNSNEPSNSRKAATGLLQLADLLSAVGGNVLGETTQKLGDALRKESDPELESLLAAAFVRLSSEATQRKHYRAVVQCCETMDYLSSRRPALEKELRSRIGVEARLAEFIEDALAQQQLSPDLLSVLYRNCNAAAEQLAERFFRSMRREECDRIVDVVQELGVTANNCLRDMLRIGPQRQAVSSVGLLSRLDVPGLLEFLPLRLPGWNRFYHDVIVRQIAYGAASDRGRTLLEILEILDPTVVPQALDEIGMSGDRSAAPPLIVMAGAGETSGRSPLLQLKAIEALGRLREPDAVFVLKNLFESKRMFKWLHHRELRIAAAQALAKIDLRYATQIMADSGLEPGELAIGPLDSAPACPWVRQRRYERILLRKPVIATVSSSWGKSTLSIRELSLGGGMGTKEDSLRIGSDADIDIQMGMRHIRGQVVLRRAHVNEVGFEFVNTDLESRHRLRHLLMDSLTHAPEPRSGKWSNREGQI